MLAAVFAHVLYASLIASIIIVLLFLMKRSIGDRLSARVYHLMWILVLVRLVMPFEIESPYSIARILPERHYLLEYSWEDINNADDKGANVTAQGHAFTGLDNDNDQTAAGSFASITMISTIWLMGCGLAAGFYAFAALRFKRKSKTFAQVYDPDIIAMAQRCSARLGIKKTIPVYMDTYFHSPCITGIFNPKIYLPRDIFDQIQYYQLEHILLHELAHYKRKDLIGSMWATIAGIMHWFNPLVWLAIREMRYDREIAADLYVMELLGETAVIPYGTTLIKLASLFPSQPAPLNWASFNGTRKTLERRIIMIKGFKQGSYKMPLLAVIIVILLGTLTFTLTSSAKNPLLEANSSAVNPDLKGVVVVIDPGHGGMDDGATYPQDDSASKSADTKEKDLNLKIALRLSELLQKSGIQVVMTRQDDSTVELDKRVELVNSSQAALVVSIHQDMHPDETKNGTRVMYYSTHNMVDKEAAGEKAAQILQATLADHLGTKDLGTSNAKLRMLSDTKVPAVITNIAFISNQSDREKLLTDEFQQSAAQALHDGIIAVLKEMD